MTKHSSSSLGYKQDIQDDDIVQYFSDCLIAWDNKKDHFIACIKLNLAGLNMWSVIEATIQEVPWTGSRRVNIITSRSFYSESSAMMHYVGVVARNG